LLYIEIKILKLINMKKLLIFLFIMMIITTFYSCVGFQSSSSIGVGVSGGPYGPSYTPNVNYGVYRGGYRGGYP
jgi:hypothetical protein